ncbi:hypothetical protein [Chthonobacter albigriseus]|uniref:hypothetical protein n=1 Tax=Chthonobacter albigriseus TaxID=1683161 RepID=UPI0015EE68E2|nr:hypothetical protein [Chthonobacter albigriseus]
MALSLSEIRDLIGPVDEATAAEVLRIGANRAEIIEAMAWINADEAQANAGRKPASGLAAAVIDILLAEDEDEDGPGDAGPSDFV